MKKRGSLNLSVNAIVVFILAFAMLGVGLYFIGMMREKLIRGGVEAFDVNDLENPPTYDTPLIVSEEVIIKKGDTMKIEIGYYNKGPSDAKLVVPEFEVCYDVLTNSEITSDLPKIVAVPAIVKPGDGIGYRVAVSIDENNANFVVNQDYICKITMVKTSGAGSEIHDESIVSQNVYLKVTS